MKKHLANLKSYLRRLEIKLLTKALQRLQYVDDTTQKLYDDLPTELVEHYHNKTAASYRKYVEQLKSGKRLYTPAIHTVIFKPDSELTQYRPYNDDAFIKECCTKKEEKNK